MDEKPTYYDIRSGFWRRHFEMASDYDSFLKGSDPELAQRWIDSVKRTPSPSTTGPRSTS